MSLINRTYLIFALLLAGGSLYAQSPYPETLPAYDTPKLAGTITGRAFGELSTINDSGSIRFIVDTAGHIVPPVSARFSKRSTVETVTRGVIHEHLTPAIYRGQAVPSELDIPLMLWTDIRDDGLWQIVRFGTREGDPEIALPPPSSDMQLREDSNTHIEPIRRPDSTGSIDVKSFLSNLRVDRSTLNGAAETGLEIRIILEPDGTYTLPVSVDSESPGLILPVVQAIEAGSRVGEPGQFQGKAIRSLVTISARLFLEEETGDVLCWIFSGPASHTMRRLDLDPEERVEEYFTFGGSNIELPKYQARDLAENVSYPLIARENGLEGRVVLVVDIDSRGEIDQIRIVRSANAIFNLAAVEGILKTRFTPATRNGEVIPYRMPVYIDFRLE